MTLDEAIKHCEKVAKRQERECQHNRNHGGTYFEDLAKNNEKCAAEHRQLVAWLTELKQRREPANAYKVGNRWHCGKCSTAVGRFWQYCQKCGTLINWENKEGKTKTIDEIIKAWEYCLDEHYRDCRGCPYGEEESGEAACFENDKKDALVYLKEYRQTRQDLLDEMKRLEGKELMFIHCLANLEDNPPLTWEELRKFEGKPVWIEMLVKDSDPNSSRWMLIQSDLCFGNAFFIDRSRARYQFFERDMNIIWQAYRKEPDHADEA